MAKGSQLANYRRLLDREAWNGGVEAERSIEEISRRAIDNLSRAIDKVREEANSK